MENKTLRVLFTNALLQFYDALWLQSKNTGHFLEEYKLTPTVTYGHVRYALDHQRGNYYVVADPRYDRMLGLRPKGYYAYYLGYMAGMTLWNSDVSVLAHMASNCMDDPKREGEDTCRRLQAFLRKTYGCTSPETYKNIHEKIKETVPEEHAWTPSAEWTIHMASAKELADLKKLDEDISSEEIKVHKEIHDLYSAMEWYDTLLHGTHSFKYPEVNASAELLALQRTPDVDGFSRLVEEFREKNLEMSLCSRRFSKSSGGLITRERVIDVIKGFSDGIDAESTAVKNSRDRVKKTLQACDTMHVGMPTRPEALKFLERYRIAPEKLCRTLVRVLRVEPNGLRASRYLASSLKPDSE